MPGQQEPAHRGERIDVRCRPQRAGSRPAGCFRRLEPGGPTAGAAGLPQQPSLPEVGKQGPAFGGKENVARRNVAVGGSPGVQVPQGGRNAHQHAHGLPGGNRAPGSHQLRHASARGVLVEQPGAVPGLEDGMQPDQVRVLQAGKDVGFAPHLKGVCRALCSLPRELQCKETALSVPQQPDGCACSRPQEPVNGVPGRLRCFGAVPGRSLRTCAGRRFRCGLHGSQAWTLRPGTGRLSTRYPACRSRAAETALLRPSRRVVHITGAGV